jgi:acyl carrier protein
MALTTEDLRTALARDVGIDTADINGATPLFSGGILNSFSLVALIGVLEERSGIKIHPMDLTLDNFDTIDRMLAYVARSHAAAANGVGSKTRA